MIDRIEVTYSAIDQMAASHGKPRPKNFGGGKWNKNEELARYVLQVGDRYSQAQWNVILLYAVREKGFNLKILKRLQG